MTQLKPLHDRPNMTLLGDGMYLVRSQAGLRKAIKAQFVEGRGGLKVFGYPDKYPAVISLTKGYRGYEYIEICQVHLNDLKAVLSKQGEI